MRIVQFTDTHLIPAENEKFLGVDTFLTLQKSLEMALLLDPLPDAFIVTGDIAESGDAATYLRFKEIFGESAIPVFTLPGNHDNKDVMKEFFQGSKIQTNECTSLGNHLFIFLNSYEQRKPHGFLTKEALERLQQLLKDNSGKPVVISLHHPPLSPCPAPGCKLQGDDELMQILGGHDRPITVLSGHLHSEVDEIHGNVRLLTSPSTFAQCRHPLEGEDVDLTDFWKSHQMDITRQGFRVIDLSEDGSTQTKIHWF